MQDLRELYRQDDYPVFQNRVYDAPEAAMQCPKGQIRLVQDLKTGLVFNAAFEPALMTYDSAYQNEQAYSGVFQSHLQQVQGIIQRTLGKHALIEVGCGKGFFLEQLLANDFDIAGFDPAYEGSNVRIRKEPFQPESKMTGKGLVLRHVLEHIPDPYAFLDQIAESNGREGKIYIEVPCLEWILRKRAWFDVFYEHVNYFRVSDLRRMFGSVDETGFLFGGQYIYIVADLASLQCPDARGSGVVSMPVDFCPDFHAIGSDPLRKLAIWGGSSKGVIYALLAQRSGVHVQCIIDISPEKQGKYAPASGIRIDSPATALAGLEKGFPIHVMNSNYLQEIRDLSGNRYQYIEVENAS